MPERQYYTCDSCGKGEEGMAGLTQDDGILNYAARIVVCPRENRQEQAEVIILCRKCLDRIYPLLKRD